MLPLSRLKLSDDSKKIDYAIECVNPQNYKLRLTFHADQLLLKKIWNFRKNQLLRKKGIDTRNHTLDEVKEFKVPDQYHNFLKISIKSAFVTVAKVFQNDGITLLSHDLVNAIYILNEKGGWDIHIFLEGIYSKK